MDDGYIEDRNGLTDLQMLEEQQRQDVEFTANLLASQVWRAKTKLLIMFYQVWRAKINLLKMFCNFEFSNIYIY